MRWFFILLTYFLFGQAFADLVPLEGSVIKGSLVIGRSTFALPPGDWAVVAINSGTTPIDDIKRGSEFSSVYLAQSSKENIYIASMLFRAPFSTTGAVVWKDKLCDRKDTLYRDNFEGRFDFPECLLINHINKFWLTEPKNPESRKIWEWYRKNNIQLPLTILNGSYRKYFSGDYVSVDISVNPEYFGQDKSVKSTWVESEWHPLIVKDDIKRLHFLKNFKTWLYIMANSANNTLKDRKPKSEVLPTLDVLHEF